MFADTAEYNKKKIYKIIVGLLKEIVTTFDNNKMASNGEKQPFSRITFFLYVVHSYMKYATECNKLVPISLKI